MNTITNFGERLNELIFDKNITPEFLAELIGVNIATVYRWKNNDTDISLNNLLKLANCFNCSIDFLLGRSDETTKYNLKTLEPFSKRLREVMKTKNISTYKLRQISKYDGKYFQKWDRGAEPISATLIELANIFDCTIDYLIGRED